MRTGSCGQRRGDVLRRRRERGTGAESKSPKRAARVFTSFELHSSRYHIGRPKSWDAHAGLINIIARVIVLVADAFVEFAGQLALAFVIPINAADAFAGFTDQTGRAIRFRSTSTLGKENIDLILD